MLCVTFFYFDGAEKICFTRLYQNIKDKFVKDILC